MPEGSFRALALLLHEADSTRFGYGARAVRFRPSPFAR